METEIWEDVIGYDGLYQVSSLGNVKNKLGKIKSCRNDKDGYLLTTLSNKKRETYRVHRLVAQTFIPNPENKKTVNHKNGIKNDNRVENLEWSTSSENHFHKYRVLGYKSGNFGKKRSLSKNPKKINQYDLQGNFIKTWDSIINISKSLGISYICISNVCKGKKNRKTAGGFIWKYFNN